MGRSRAAAFSPSQLKAIRANWIANGICRTQVNIRAGRIKRVLKWGVSEEMVPVAVWQALLTVAGLQAGRSEARETHKIRLVADAGMKATLPFLRPQVRDMIEVLRLTGMRPGEVWQVCWGAIDRTDAVWVFRPTPRRS